MYSVLACDDLLYVLYVCKYFFFFKQKTAYEMRISDWSSDVCSSDLRIEPRVAHADQRNVEADEPGLEHLQHLRAQASRLQPCAVGLEPQIGRASCRERVCQYV